MIFTNFTFYDITSVFSGFALFSLIFIPPGYVTGFAFNLFDFRSRKQSVKLGIALILSTAIVPILYFLSYRLASESFTIFILFTFVFLFLFLFLREGGFSSIVTEVRINRQIQIILGIMIGWFFIVIVSLVDIQIGKRLYFNIVAYDYQTRILVVNAITRTGVPPVNPSYYPGHTSKLTFLYYFWYILCSLVDKLGGKIIDARTALIASVVWAGLAIMCTIAFYLRLRNAKKATDHWRTAIIGIFLLAVSGLDIFGSTFYMLFPKYLYGYFIDGDIEHWNEQITAWAGTTMWTPHHLAAMLICISGWMLVFYHEKLDARRRIVAVFLAGLAFASAFGLSTWVTFIFAIFWIYWIIRHLLAGERIKTMWILFIPGVVASISIFPFILDLASGGEAGSSLRALAFDVRWFRPAIYFIFNTPTWYVWLVNLLLLPFNYFLELGFFFIAGTLWLSLIRKNYLERTIVWREEIVLLGIAAFLTSFTRSTLIANNDFGWRGWLPGQFILLIWGTDILVHYWGERSVNWGLLLAKPMKMKRIKYLLLVLLALGVLTTTQDLALLRIWPILVDTKVVNLPVKFRNEEYTGLKTYEARVLFSRIEDTFPPTTIVQFNPSVGMNRATGLYRTRNSVLSFHTLYGVPEISYKPLGISLVKIFRSTFSRWKDLDTVCSQNKIGILIIEHEDELWKSVSLLAKLRQPIYRGEYYTAFECGN